MRSSSSSSTKFGIILVPSMMLACISACGSDRRPPVLVSFKNDLIARPGTSDVTFESSCGLSTSCHENPVQNTATDRVFLGCDPAKPPCKATEPVSEQVYAGLVGNPDAGMLAMSLELPSMAYVQPGDPDHSYLVRKIEGSLSDLQSQCSPDNPLVVTISGEGDRPPPPCGLQMPETASPDPDFIARVRLWIAQGALDN